MTALECAQLKEIWKDRIADFHASGLSGREWCAQRGVTVERLRHWTRKLAPTDADASEATWVAVDLAPAFERSADGLAVTVGPATITVRPGFDPALLQRLVQVLATC